MKKKNICCASCQAEHKIQPAALDGNQVVTVSEL